MKIWAFGTKIGGNWWKRLPAHPAWETGGNNNNQQQQQQQQPSGMNLGVGTRRGTKISGNWWRRLGETGGNNNKQQQQQP